MSLTSLARWAFFEASNVEDVEYICSIWIWIQLQLAFFRPQLISNLSFPTLALRVAR